MEEKKYTVGEIEEWLLGYLFNSADPYNPNHNELTASNKVVSFLAKQLRDDEEGIDAVTERNKND